MKLLCKSSAPWPLKTETLGWFPSSRDGVSNCLPCRETKNLAKTSMVLQENDRVLLSELVCFSPKLDFFPYCFSKQNDLEVSPFNNQTSSDSSASCTRKVPRVNHLQPAVLPATAKYPLTGHVCFNLELTFIATYWNILKTLVGKDFIDEHRWTYSSLFFLPGGYANFNFPLFWSKISCSWTSSTLEEIASYDLVMDAHWDWLKLLKTAILL